MKLKGEVKHFVAEVQKHLPPEHHARLRALSAKYLSEQRTIARTLSHQQRVIAQQRDKSAAQAAEITMLRGEVQDGKNAISQLQHELAQMQMNIADYLVAIGSAALWGVDLQAKVSGAAKHAHSTGKINTAIE